MKGKRQKSLLYCPPPRSHGTSTPYFFLLEKGCYGQRSVTRQWRIRYLANPATAESCWSHFFARTPGHLSFSGDIQDPPGQGPLQPTVGDPALAGGLDWVIHRGPFQPRPFCDSVILRHQANRLDVPRCRQGHTKRVGLSTARSAVGSQG